MKARASLYVVVLIAAIALAVGCNKAPNDAQVSSDIQSKLNSDSGLQGKQISVQSSNGIVTLTGSVDNDAQRDAAARYASSEPGVHQIINNLKVPEVSAPAETAQETPAPAPKPSPRARHVSRPHRAPPPSDSSTNDVTTTTMASSAPPAPINLTPPPPTGPPPPQKVTIPSGTTMAVRLVDTIDSERSQPGQTFHATLDSPLAGEGGNAGSSGYDGERPILGGEKAREVARETFVPPPLVSGESGGKNYAIPNQHDP